MPYQQAPYLEDFNSRLTRSVTPRQLRQRGNFRLNLRLLRQKILEAEVSLATRSLPLSQLNTRLLRQKRLEAEVSRAKRNRPLRRV